jgi:predicted TIM-barrel fold metal-dependent hydrolase
LRLKHPLPHPMLVVKQHEIVRPLYSAIDAHNHLGAAFGGNWNKRSPAELIDVMDQAGIRTIVNLDGGFSDQFYTELERWSPLGERVLVFTGVGWERVTRSSAMGELAAKELESAVKAGAKGLKIWKDFGLRVKDEAGRLLAVDTAKLDPLWAKAGELGVPVLIHVGDPAAFFQPVDEYNERFEELQRAPDWSFYSSEFPRLEMLIDALESVISRHPQTTFIGAHVGCYAENLGYVGGMLDRLPNYYVDISARIAELGRQPNTARRFFLRYADRILFGTDNAPDPLSYRLYFRFLETLDDYFPHWHPNEQPVQGRWRISGLGLPDSVLQRIYCRNAERIFHLRSKDDARAASC